VRKRFLILIINRQYIVYLPPLPAGTLPPGGGELNRTVEGKYKKPPYLSIWRLS